MTDLWITLCWQLTTLLLAVFAGLWLLVALVLVAIAITLVRIGERE